MTDNTRADRRAALIAAGAIADDHQPVLEVDPAYRPQVSPRVRDAVYWATLGAAAVDAALAAHQPDASG